MKSFSRARRLLSRASALALLLSSFQTPALAADPDPPASPTSPAPVDITAAEADPAGSIDAGDLWRYVRHKPAASDDLFPAGMHPSITVAPVISSKPSTGVAGGMSGDLTFIDGDPTTTHFSTMAGGIRFSQKEQTLGSVRFGIFTDNDQWFILGDTRIWQTSLDTYELGDSALPYGAANLGYAFYRIYDTIYYQIGHRLFAGGGVNISDHSGIRAGGSSLAVFDAAAFTSYSAAHGFALDHQVSSGMNVALQYDTRDNPINARRGTYASATYRTFFDGFMGGDSTWQELYLDARRFQSLGASGRQVLAFWLIGDLVTGGTAPFLDLPYTSSDGRSARGYAEGQFRGPQLLYGEVEYRATLTANGLIGAVAFFNTTTVDGAGGGQHLFESFEPAGGGGLRLLLNKHSRTNLCVDYGVGRYGSSGLYLGIQEAF